MKEVFRHWPELNARLQPMSKVLWLFDFDGTLTPLTKHPQISAMPMRVRELLRKLESRFPGHVGILSGRPLLQVRHKAGLAVRFPRMNRWRRRRETRIAHAGAHTGDRRARLVLRSTHRLAGKA